MQSSEDERDFFQVLGLPRLATLDEESLQNAYAQHSREAHPDHGGSEESAALVNLAYENLRATEKRLKHLLEIAGPAEAKSWRTVPLDEPMMNVFSQLGKALEGAAKLLDRKTKAQSELAKALLAGESFKLRDQLEEVGFAVEAMKVAIADQLPSLDEALKAEALEGWKQLAIVQARLAYLSRWQAQIRENLLQLMM